MPNDRLFEAAGPTGGHEEAFRRADEIIGTGVSAIWKMLVERGVINMDFAALRNLVRHSEGISVFGYGQGEGPDKAEVAVRTALASPLFENRQVLARAAAVLVSIIGGPDLTLTELRAIMERVEGAVRRDAHLLMGNVSDPRWQGQVAVTLIASEHWRDEPEPEGVPKTPETESGKGDDAAKARRARRKATEAQLRLPGQDKGIFKDVEPTIVDGQDLDLPTYRRRGVVLGK
jgi:cell division protein FtsZ